MPADTMTAPVADTLQHQAFYDRISEQNLIPLWTSLANLVTPGPRSPCQPACWRFTDVRAAMMEAGGLITAEETDLWPGTTTATTTRLQRERQ